MKIFTLLHKSTDKGTINLGQWSRMGTVNVRTTSDSILSRICLASLILLMLGGFSSRAWADNTAKITRRSLGDTDWSGIVNGNSSSAYITWKGNDSGTHVTFKLSGGTFKNSTWDYFQSTGDQTHMISWTVDAGYTISVKEVSLVVRSSLNGSTVKVGQAGYATNPYGGSDDFVTVSSGTYSPVLGNDGCVNIICKDKYNSANNFIKTVTITYTIEETEKTVTFNSSSFSSGSAPYVIRQDSVDFSLNIPNYYDSGSGNFYIHTSNTTATIGWTPKTGYAIAVTGVSLNGQNASESHWFTERIGSSYIRSHTTSNNTEVKISQSTSTATYSYTTANNTNLFPGGTALGNTAYFKLRAEKGYKDADKDRSYEYQIKTAALTYSVTPPAPTLKSGDEVTANTVTLTDYFQPFNNAASMFYEVKKWNGSAYVAVESGFQINDNVFKATTVGVFQVVAKSDAIGAFTVSAASSPITITVEEVHPLTIAVGIQELYVDGTTTMVITDQFNTTEEVVFDYDDDFFDYDEESGVLTAKNAGNASFATTEKSIHVTQASDGVIDAVDMYIDFTIKKYTSTLTCSWGAEPWSKNLNFDEEAGITFSSNNDTGTPIVVTPGAGVAAGNGSYDAENHKVIAGHNVGSATWTISQAEDYKYQAAVSKTLTVNVGTLPSPDCYVAIDTWNDNGEGHNFGSSWELNWDEEGVADSVVFTIRRSWGDTDAKCDIYATYSDGTDPFKIDRIASSWDDSYKTFGRKIPNPQATGIRFKGENGVNSRYVKNVYVYRKKWFDIENEDGDAITEIDIPSRTISGAATTATFYVDYSTCADEIKVASDNAHITADITSISSTTHGQQAITLTYNSDVAEDIAATVTIYTPYEHKTLTVNAETVSKLSTELRWKEGVSTTYSVDHANMAATDLFEVYDANGDKVANPTIKLVSSDSAKIDITVDSKDYIDFLCGDDAPITITATYAGDATYAAADDLEQEITVSKLADAITWGAAVVNDTLRVHADHDIPYTIATATHTSAEKPIVFTSGDASILRVTSGATSDELHTLKFDTVTLTATTTADCTYATASSSIVVVVLPCKQRIVWEQTFGYHTEEDGTISERVELTAYGVDSTGTPTGVEILYSMPDVDFAEIDEGDLVLSGIGETTITAATAVDNKFFVAEATRTIIVSEVGSNVAYSYNNGDDVVDGDIVIEGPHATFTISGDDDIYYYTGGSCGDDGYFLSSLDKESNQTFTLSWTCDESCTIEVTNISFWGRGYNWAAGRASKAKMVFNETTKSVGTASLTCGIDDYAKFSEDGSFTSPMTIECRNEFDAPWYDAIPPYDFDFYLKNIVIEYTITPKAPTPHDADMIATLNVESKQTKDVRVNSGEGALFTFESPASDFEYRYQLGADYGTHAHIDGNNFWADATGDYEVQARVNADEDHKYSAWSTATIHVVRTCVFNNKEGDKNWETTGNWAYNAEPTAEDAVLVLDSLTVDKEIEMLSLSIDEDGVVTIAPTGGLTIGAGGVSGATKDKLILKAQKVDDAVKGVKKGQTGYLRISPDYDGDMPEAKMEMLVKAYKDVSTGETKWQYVGSPVQSIAASAVFHYLYNWYEDAGKWKNKRSSTTMEPFKGYAATQNTDPDGDVVVFEGDLVSMGTQTVALTYTESSANPGCNVVANSFAAPIDISRMTAADFPAGAEATINFFNAGSKADLDARELTKAVDVEAAGQYIPVPVATASTLHEEFNYPIIIPSMQGFYVMTTAAGNMTLDYERLVWNADYDETTNQPLRVNRRMTKTATERDEAEVTGKMKITLATQTAIDHLILLESEDYAAYYENGYDARKMMSDDLNIFSVEGDDQLAIDATNSINGTRVGVRTGEETAYTLLFSSVNGEDEMALYDNETEQTIDINDGTQYTFFAEPNAMITGRFSIVEREAPSITTGVEKAENDTKVHKFIKDNQLYILKNGVLYNAMGAIVR